MPAIAIEPLSALPAARELSELGALLTACVEHGASIGFLLPVSSGEIEVYWRKIVSDLPGGFRVLLVARDAGRIVGSVQLALEARANGRHRAEVQKLMVLPTHRRRGIAASLMQEIEALARARGVSLLFLDTSDGPGGARAFYDALHYAYVGGIPGYALDPDGLPARNAIYYKTLSVAE
jgi:acetyltransferase